MKSILIVIIAALPIIGFGQNTYERKFSETASLFQKHFNAGQSDSVFNMFGPVMQIAFPKEKLSAYFSKVHSDKGEIIGTGLPFITALNKAEVPVYFKSDTLDLNLSLDNSNKITGFGLKSAKRRPPVLDKNIIMLIPPFKGQWQCFWGGETEEQNKHIILSNQRHAFDFVMTDSAGKSYRDKGVRNEDYYAFGQNVYAPADGIVTDVTSGVRDNEPGNLDPFFALGNSIIIKHAENEYSVLAHFKMNSIIVKVGDKVKKGQLLGLCGNSGNTTEPHVHFHLQNSPVIQDGTGIKIYFSSIKVNDKLMMNYSPVKGDKLTIE